MDESTQERTRERRSGRTDERTNARTDARAHERTRGRMNERTNERTDLKPHAVHDLGKLLVDLRYDGDDDEQRDEAHGHTRWGDLTIDLYSIDTGYRVRVGGGGRGGEPFVPACLPPSRL